MKAPSPSQPKRGRARAEEAELERQEAPELPAESPEEFALRFFGDGSPRENQEGLPTLEWLKSQFKTKSAAIRYLNNQGHVPKVIAKHLGIRYQHARNVCTTTLKRGPNEDWSKPVRDARDEELRRLREQVIRGDSDGD